MITALVWVARNGHEGVVGIQVPLGRDGVDRNKLDEWSTAYNRRKEDELRPRCGWKTLEAEAEPSFSRGHFQQSSRVAFSQIYLAYQS